jgi:hypothetical protein
MSLKSTVAGIGTAVLVGAVVGFLSAQDSTREDDGEAAALWRPACGRLELGAMVHYGDGPDRRAVGRVVAFDEHHPIPGQPGTFRGVQFASPDGGLEWKDRAAICRDPRWSVK